MPDYTSGTINIPNVTGNIVITAVATPGVVTSISAVFTQGSAVIYDTDTLDTLKQYLVVTASYDGGSSAVVTNYTLSGTLITGTSTITVSYGGETDTFDVTVTHQEAPIDYLYNWDLTKSLIDSVNDAEISLSSTGQNPTRDSQGLHFTAATQVAYLGQISMPGKTIELDIADFNFVGNSNYHIRLLMNTGSTSSIAAGTGTLIYRKSIGWSEYGFSASTGDAKSWSSTWNGLSGTSSDIINAFDGTTVKVEYGSDAHTNKLYIDGVLMGTLSDVYFVNSSGYMMIGGIIGGAESAGNQCYDMTITGIRIYETV